MLAKLAVRNVRRSARDYGVFFVTVALGVAMFYAFNAIKSQAVLYDAMTVNSLRMLELLDMMMGIFSVAVACVLGFLVVYANGFIIKRRKREFGMYLMLGMGAPRVSAILLFETVLVGLASLGVGLAVGIGLSQGLSFVTAALMGTTMTSTNSLSRAARWPSPACASWQSSPCRRSSTSCMSTAAGSHPC